MMKSKLLNDDKNQSTSTSPSPNENKNVNVNVNTNKNVISEKNKIEYIDNIIQEHFQFEKHEIQKYSNIIPPKTHTQNKTKLFNNNHNHNHNHNQRVSDERYILQKIYQNVFKNNILSFLCLKNNYRNDGDNDDDNDEFNPIEHDQKKKIYSMSDDDDDDGGGGGGERGGYDGDDERGMMMVMMKKKKKRSYSSNLLIKKRKKRIRKSSSKSISKSTKKVRNGYGRKGKGKSGELLKEKKRTLSNKKRFLKSYNNNYNKGMSYRGGGNIKRRRSYSNIVYKTNQSNVINRRVLPSLNISYRNVNLDSYLKRSSPNRGINIAYKKRIVSKKRKSLDLFGSKVDDDKKVSMKKNKRRSSYSDNALRRDVKTFGKSNPRNVYGWRNAMKNRRRLSDTYIAGKPKKKKMKKKKVIVRKVKRKKPKKTKLYELI